MRGDQSKILSVTNNFQETWQYGDLAKAKKEYIELEGDLCCPVVYFFIYQ